MTFFDKAQRIHKALNKEFNFLVKDNELDIPGLYYSMVYHDSTNEGESFLSVSGYISKDAMERYQAKRYPGDHIIPCTSIINDISDFSKTINDINCAGVLEAELFELFWEHVQPLIRDM